MIEHILVSRVRVKVLKHFFLDTETETHIRGIVRAIDEEINAVRRELKNLEEAKILVSEKRGNRLYFKSDPNCPIYYELVGLVHKEFGLGKFILENKDSFGEVEFAVLTTAYLEDHHPSPYDVDVLVVGKLNMKAVANAVKQAEQELNREIRYTVMNKEELEFRKKKRDNFIFNILNKHKIMLVGDENQLLA